VPPAKREHGYFVMPDPARDGLIGRIDPSWTGRPRAPRETRSTRSGRPGLGRLRRSPGVRELAAWLGASDVAFAAAAPLWHAALRA